MSKRKKEKAEEMRSFVRLLGVVGGLVAGAGIGVFFAGILLLASADYPDWLLGIFAALGALVVGTMAMRDVTMDD